MSVHPDDKCLFHYTTFDSLQKILQSRVVRASDVRYQNDSSEYMYSVDLLANHVAELTANGSLVGFEKVCLDSLVMRAQASGSGEDSYIFCLSENENQLSQWRGYSGGGGVAVGFGLNRLEALAKLANASLVKCEYNRTVHEQGIADFVTKIRQDIAPHANLPPVNAVKLFWWGPKGAKLGGRAEEFMRLATSYKHPKFLEEAEWRLVAFGEESKRRVRISVDGMPIPYVPISIAESDHDNGVRLWHQVPIMRLILGPNSNAVAVERSTWAMFFAEDIIPPPLEQSGIPFRGALR